MTANTLFKWEVLYPELFDHIPNIEEFKEFQFKKSRIGGSIVWISPFKLDGTKSKSHRPDKTIISETFCGYMKENGEDRPREIIDFYQEKTNLSFYEALQALAKIAGVEDKLPNRDPDFEKNQKEESDRQNKLLASWERQKKALFTPEGLNVLNYLKGERRKLSEDEIRALPFGFISPDEANRIKQETGIAISVDVREYPLSFPYYSKGRIQGFKVRVIDPEIEAVKDKYINSVGIKKNENPFGLSAVTQYHKPETARNLIAVEGEIDALRCIYHGFPNVIPTSGNALSPVAISEIKKRGFRNIILLMDNDKAGNDYVLKSIHNIEHEGLVPFVVLLPDGMDPDDFFKDGKTAEELNKLIQKAKFGKFFEYERILQQNGTNLSDVDSSDLTEKIIDLANQIKDPVVRRKVLLDFARRYGNGSISSLEKAVSLKADKEREESERAKKKERIEKAVQTSLSLLQEGKVSDAEKTLSKVREDIQQIANRDKYKEYLFSNSDEIFQFLRELPHGLNSGFQLSGTTYEGKTRREIYQNVTFPEGGITIIGGCSNHGKSAVLKNIAINALNERDKNGRPISGNILYFTYEENVESVTRQFINAYANVNLNPDEGITRKTNIEIIEEFFAGYDTHFVRNNQKKKTFVEKVIEFKGILDSQRLKIIRLPSNDYSELLDVVEYLKTETNVRAVLLDYIQELSASDKNGKTVLRTEELKEVMTSIDKFTQEARIPFVMTAQIQRNVKNPEDLTNDCLSDSSWIEKTASEIILMWSNKFKTEYDKKNNNTNPDPLLRDGQGGIIYVTLTKSRRYKTGTSAYLNIDSRTGRITQEGTRPFEEKTPHRMKDFDKLFSESFFDSEFFKDEEPLQGNGNKSSYVLPTPQTTIRTTEEPEPTETTEEVPTTERKDDLPF